MELLIETLHRRENFLAYLVIVLRQSAYFHCISTLQPQTAHIREFNISRRQLKTHMIPGNFCLADLLTEKRRSKSPCTIAKVPARWMHVQRSGKVRFTEGVGKKQPHPTTSHIVVRSIRNSDARELSPSVCHSFSTHARLNLISRACTSCNIRQEASPLRELILHVVLKHSQPYHRLRTKHWSHDDIRKNSA